MHAALSATRRRDAQSLTGSYEGSTEIYVTYYAMKMICNVSCIYTSTNIGVGYGVQLCAHAIISMWCRVCKMPPPLVSPFPRPSKKGGERVSALRVSRRSLGRARGVRGLRSPPFLVGRGGGKTRGWGILRTRHPRTPLLSRSARLLSLQKYLDRLLTARARAHAGTQRG